MIDLKDMNDIFVTKPYLPSKDIYKDYIDHIFACGVLTNKGQFVDQLESRLTAFLGVKNVICVANGTIALQVLYKALGLRNEVITTPFSFVATSSSLSWEGLIPKFVDIDDTWNLSPDLVNEGITKKTSAIVPVHVYGNPCDVEAFEYLSSSKGIPVIYDAAHAFGVGFAEKSLLSFGVASTLSFHATKIFHSIEGGAIVTNDADLAKKIRNMINFGIVNPTTINTLGINAKMSEFHAVMGLAVLDKFEEILKKRKDIYETYCSELSGLVEFQKITPGASYNYSYVPVLFHSELELLKVMKYLEKYHVFTRRYFYPLLSSLDFLPQTRSVPMAKSISDRVLCLPSYHDLDLAEVGKVIELIKKKLSC